MIYSILISIKIYGYSNENPHYQSFQQTQKVTKIVLFDDGCKRRTLSRPCLSCPTEKLDPERILVKFETRTDKFLAENPKYIKQIKEFDEMYKDNFATLKKGDDGLCVLLDKESMKCTIYENRPKVCKNYTYFTEFSQK